MANVRWHKGQRHYSGTYWSATERGHVIYESRLSRRRPSWATCDFLAGFRQSWLFGHNLLDELRASDYQGISLGKACHSLPN